MLCEQCWDDAYLRTLTNPGKSQMEHYLDLLEERKNTPCKRGVTLGM
ncbi:MAG: hypothetical protein WCE94_03270 [Candidatus Methanoperedens sp.]